MSGGQALQTLMVIWGVPGSGKSTFARWLVNSHGYLHAETDAGADVNHALVLARRGYKVVIEWGAWARQDAIDFVSGWAAEGAQAFWFNGDRDAAFKAWRHENVKSHRPYPDQLWHDVVGEIDRNWSLLQDLFGSDRMLRTVLGGPVHVPPEETYAKMEQILST